MTVDGSTTSRHGAAAFTAKKRAIAAAGNEHPSEDLALALAKKSEELEASKRLNQELIQKMEELRKENKTLHEVINSLEGKMKEELAKNTEAMRLEMKEMSKNLTEKFNGMLAGQLNSTRTSSASTPTSSAAPSSAPTSIHAPPQAPPHSTVPSWSQLFKGAPAHKPFTREEWNMFNAPSLPRQAPPTLSLSGSDEDLLKSVERFYVDDIEPVRISDLKATLRNRNIAVNHIISLDFVGYRYRFRLKRFTLEVVCHQRSAATLRRELVQRFGAKILNNYAPEKASNPNAGDDIKAKVLKYYQQRMLRHANRQEDRNLGRRKLFGIYYLQAGGKKEDLTEIVEEVEEIPTGGEQQMEGVEGGAGEGSKNGGEEQPADVN